MKPLLVRPRERALSHLSPSPPWLLELLPTLPRRREADSGDAGTLFEVRRHRGADRHTGFSGGRMRRTWHLASTTPPTEPGASPPSAPGSLPLEVLEVFT